MSDHKLLYVFAVFSLLALIILGAATYNSVTYVVPVIITNQTSTLTGYASYGNPCQISQCYYEGKYCYDHGETIINRVPKDNCVVREVLRCWNGDWLYDSTPQQFCY